MLKYLALVVVVDGWDCIGKGFGDGGYSWRWGGDGGGCRWKHSLQKDEHWSGDVGDASLLSLVHHWYGC